MGLIKYTILLLLLFSGTIIYSQSIYKTIEGKVDTKVVNIEGIHVFNISNDKATITNNKGNFKITVKLNDTLMFSAIHLKKEQLIVTFDILKKGSLIVLMSELVNELDEVVVRPYGLSGDLTTDAKKLQTSPLIIASSLGLPNADVKKISQAERQLYTATKGVGALILINLINGDIRKHKERIQREEKYNKTGRVKDLFSDTIYTYNLNVPKEMINDFFYFCELDPVFIELIESENKLILLEYLEAKSNIYIKNRDSLPY